MIERIPLAYAYTQGGVRRVKHPECLSYLEARLTIEIDSPDKISDITLLSISHPITLQTLYHQKVQNFFYFIILKDKERIFNIAKQNNLFVKPLVTKHGETLGYLYNVNDKSAYTYIKILKSGMNRVKNGTNYFKFYIVGRLEGMIDEDEKIFKIFNEDCEKFKEKIEKDIKIFKSMVEFFGMKR